MNLNRSNYLVTLGWQLIIVFASVTFANSSLGGDEIETIVVQGDASVNRGSSTHLSVSGIDQDEVAFVRSEHPNGILSRVPGIWVTRNSGQEHLIGIRSGVLTGPGACGAVLLLENGIPVRPQGFCNVNGLFEINIEQANRIEVVRGPASSSYGGNALHGMINVITMGPRETDSVDLSIGPDDWWQAQWDATTKERTGSVYLHVGSNNGFRKDTGYSQQKISLYLRSRKFNDWIVQQTLSGSNLNQETGGYVRGYRAYEVDDLRFSNPNPEAYRDAGSLRYAQHWYRDGTHVIPYIRHSSMTFLQHFLPGQPLEKNSQTSGGLITRWPMRNDQISWSIGQMTELMVGELSQYQDSPTAGSAFLMATRPQGVHYDYSIRSASIAVFHDVEWAQSESLDLVHGGRIEYLRYEYENHARDGNTRDDGTVCGFGGCLYTRPSDRTDSFINIALNGGMRYELTDSVGLFFSTGMGFRPPQATELYRLQSGQQVADLDSESLWSLEAGLTKSKGVNVAELKIYSQRKRDAILRDSEGLNINRGRTQSHGVEVQLERSFGAHHEVGLTLTVADHKYDFTHQVARGEQITSGNEVDSAPRLMYNARWKLSWTPEIQTAVEFVHVGSHYINASNTAKYGGHNVVNLRTLIGIDWRRQLQFNIMNVLDERYADRADFAFGSYRYFPARPRQVFVSLNHEF